MTGTTHVALLRGINVGGKHPLPMKELTALFTAAGCTEVSTYIQSGNVVFRAPAELAPRLPAGVGRRIQERFGFDAPVVLRTAGELAAVVRGNPFLTPDADTAPLHVMFLAGEPSPDAVARLDHQRSPGDSFAVRGREVYLHCPSGVARTRLTNGYFDTALGTTTTSRNWRTVLKLLELAGG
jgi:uncharacterized protein (DUF1697 family)